MTGYFVILIINSSPPQQILIQILICQYRSSSGLVIYRNCNPVTFFSIHRQLHCTDSNSFVFYVDFVDFTANFSRASRISVFASAILINFHILLRGNSLRMTSPHCVLLPISAVFFCSSLSHRTHRIIIFLPSAPSPVL